MPETTDPKATKVTATHTATGQQASCELESSTRRNKEKAWQTVAAKIWHATNVLPKIEEFTFEYEE